MSPLIVLSKIRQAGGSISVQDQELRIQAPPGLLSTKDRGLLVQYKTDLVKLLAPTHEQREREAIEWESSASDEELDAALDQAQSAWEEAIALPPECETCGAIEFWWDSWGDHHCERCDPPRTLKKPHKSRGHD